MGMSSLGAAAAQDKLVRDGIVATLAEGLAPQDAPAAEQRAPQGAEAGYGNPRVIGTGWMEPAIGPQQGTEPPLVKGQQEEEEAGHCLLARWGCLRWALNSIPEDRLLG